MIYSTSIKLRRLTGGVRWEPYPSDLRFIRRTYRELRKQGMNKLNARWLISDLMMAGRYSTKANAA